MQDVVNVVWLYINFHADDFGIGGGRGGIAQQERRARIICTPGE